MLPCRENIFRQDQASFFDCYILAADNEQQQSRSHTLHDQPAGHHLFVAPALILAGVVVQRGAGVLEDGNVQKALQADLQDAQTAIHDEHEMCIRDRAKSCHDELETYYRAAVDFGKVDEAAAECMEMFGLK